MTSVSSAWPQAKHGKEVLALFVRDGLHDVSLAWPLAKHGEYLEDLVRRDTGLDFIGLACGQAWRAERGTDAHHAPWSFIGLAAGQAWRGGREPSDPGITGSVSSALPLAKHGKLSHQAPGV